MASATGDLPRLLEACSSGDEEALRQLVASLYQDLRQVARQQLRRLRPGETLNTTALVHELYFKLADRSALSPRDRGHFLAIAARAMRQILVDYARRQAVRSRRPQAEASPVFLVQGIGPCHSDRLLAVNEALSELGQVDERLVRMTECRFFAGMTEAETAQAMDLSVRTVQRDWKRARAWLRRFLEPEDASPA